MGTKRLQEMMVPGEADKLKALFAALKAANCGTAVLKLVDAFMIEQGELRLEVEVDTDLKGNITVHFHLVLNCEHILLRLAPNDAELLMDMFTDALAYNRAITGT